MASNTNAVRLEQLRLLLDDWITAYRASITLVTSTGVKPSYSVGGQSVSWGEVYSNGARIIADLVKLINALSWADGPVDGYVRA